MTVVLDAADRRIVAALQADGRMSNADLAEAAGLSPSACHRRVRQLEARGLIRGYAMIVDPAKAGLPGNVFVDVSLARQTQEAFDAFEAAVRRLPEVIECHLMAGDSDYLLRIAVSDAADYERIHRTVLSHLPGLARIRSTFTLRTVCDRPSVPLR